MISSGRVSFAHEYPKLLRIGFAGCGGQAYRNLFPSLAYAPIRLVATCDVVLDRAKSYARQFGAERFYERFDEMLEKEDLDAIFLATGYDQQGVPLYPRMAIQAMSSGRHVWIEKPPAWSLAEIEEMASVSAQTGRQVGVGFMKMFGAGARKVRELMQREEFGRVTSIGLRDPEKLPPSKDRCDPSKMNFFLDHIVHPISLIHFLMGPIQRFHVEAEPAGASVITFRFVDGACGFLYMPWGQSSYCPKERLEVVGEGANIVLENNSRLSYYRPGHPGRGEFSYGRVGDFTGTDEQAPWCWEMDCYSGQLMNNPLFYAGYAPEIVHYAEALLSGRELEAGTLGDAWHVLRFVEALRSAENEPVGLASPPDWAQRGAVLLRHKADDVT